MPVARSNKRTAAAAAAEAAPEVAHEKKQKIDVPVDVPAVVAIANPSSGSSDSSASSAREMRPCEIEKAAFSVARTIIMTRIKEVQSSNKSAVPVAVQKNAEATESGVDVQPVHDALCAPVTALLTDEKAIKKLLQDIKLAVTPYASKLVAAGAKKERRELTQEGKEQKKFIATACRGALMAGYIAPAACISRLPATLCAQDKDILTAIINNWAAKKGTN